MSDAEEYATTLNGLCDQLGAFCTQHYLPRLSADEILCELYGEGPRRNDLCQWLKGFIDAWDQACDAERKARANPAGPVQ